SSPPSLLTFVSVANSAFLLQHAELLPPIPNLKNAPSWSSNATQPKHPLYSTMPLLLLPIPSIGPSSIRPPPAYRPAFPARVPSCGHGRRSLGSRKGEKAANRTN